MVKKIDIEEWNNSLANVIINMPKKEWKEITKKPMAEGVAIILKKTKEKYA
jgi:hypothetical protein